ncbi:hypothetical protein, partial [Endozoicomonas sp. ONNA2]|uniref:hypothetical protein n=1 Tax=Endozoicomonas sp. ONNA2 TaxID=2828741 RepID=UPI002148D792
SCPEITSTLLLYSRCPHPEKLESLVLLRAVGDDNFLTVHLASPGAWPLLTTSCPGLAFRPIYRNRTTAWMQWPEQRRSSCRAGPSIPGQPPGECQSDQGNPSSNES